jgi:hypothetical protein
MSEDIRKQGEQLWANWTAMWNGDPALAEKIVAPGFWAHTTLEVAIDPREVRDAAAVAGWVRSFRQGFERLVYTTAEGPFVDVERGVIMCNWFVDGVYAGRTNRPGDVAGAVFRKAGLDMLAFRDGRVTECWTLSGDITGLARERF